MDARFDAMDARFDAMDARMRTVETGYAELKGQIDLIAKYILTQNLRASDPPPDLAPGD